MTTPTLNRNHTGGHMPEPSLTDFLLDRINEDQQALAGLTENYDYFVGRIKSHKITQVVLAPHFARWDPARVLAECETKRAIIRVHTPSDEFPCCAGCHLYTDRHGEYGPCTTLRLLALPYANHPDYQPGWRP